MVCKGIESATAEVSSLSPSTQYFLHCVAVPYSKEYSMSIAKKEPFTTDPGNLFPSFIIYSSFFNKEHS